MNAMRKLLCIALVLILCIGVFCMPAAAAEVTEEGLKTVLTTDAATYAAEDKIIVTVTVTNTNSYEMTDVVLSLEIPEGYRLAQGCTASKLVATLAAGASESHSVTLEPDSPSKTGDNGPVALVGIVLLAAAAAVGVLLFVYGKKTRRAVAMFVAVILVVSILPVLPVTAKAEADPSKAETTENIPVDASVSETVTVAEAPLNLNACVTANHAITRKDLQDLVVETAWAYYMKEAQVQYESNPFTAITDKNYGVYRVTEGQAPEYATSDTTHFSVCTYFCFDTYFNVLMDANGIGYRMGRGDDAADARTHQLWANVPVDDESVVLRWSSNPDETRVNIGTDVALTAKDFAAWLGENNRFLDLLEPGDVVVVDGHATIYIGDGMMLECTGGKYSAATGLDTYESAGAIKLNAFDNYYINSASNAYLGKAPAKNVLIIRPLNHVVGDNDILDPAKGYFLNAGTITRKEYSGVEIDRTVDASPYGTVAKGGTLTYKLTITNNSSNTRANVVAETYDGIPVNYPNWVGVHYGLENYAGTDYEALPVTQMIPEGTSLVEGSITGGGKLENGVITWSLDLAAGEKITLSYTVKADEAAIGDVIVNDGGHVGNIPSNTLRNRVGGEKLSAAALANVEAYDGFAEQYTDNITAKGVANGIYEEVLGLKLDLPDVKILVEAIFETKAVESGSGGATTDMLVLKPWDSRSVYRSMLVDRYIAGYNVHTEHLKNERIWDLNVDYLEPGDILVKVESLSSYAATTVVYLGEDRFAAIDEDGYAASTTAPSLYRDMFRSKYACVFLLRPSQAHADLNTDLTAATPFVPDPSIESSGSDDTPAEPGTLADWQKAIVETAYTYHRANANAIYSNAPMTALGEAGIRKATWNVAPEEITADAPYYGVAEYLIYEIFRNAVNVKLSSDQDGMLNTADLTAAYAAEGTEPQVADIAVTAEGVLALYLGDGKYLTMLDQANPIVITDSITPAKLLRPLATAQAHLTAAGAARIAFSKLDADITSNLSHDLYGTASQGQKVTYTITVTNGSDAPYSGLEIVQFVPRKATFLDVTANHSDSTAQFSYNADNGKLTWTADIPAGGSITVSYTVTVKECLGGLYDLYYLTTNGKVGANGAYLPMGDLNHRIGYQKGTAENYETLLGLTKDNLPSGVSAGAVGGVRKLLVSLGWDFPDSAALPGITAIIGMKNMAAVTITYVDDSEVIYNGYGILSDENYVYGRQLMVEGFYGGSLIYAEKDSHSVVLNPSLAMLEPGDVLMGFYESAEGLGSMTSQFWVYLGQDAQGNYKVLNMPKNAVEVKSYTDGEAFFEEFGFNGDSANGKLTAYMAVRPSQVKDLAEAPAVKETEPLEITLNNDLGRGHTIFNQTALNYTLTLTNNTSSAYTGITVTQAVTGGTITAAAEGGTIAADGKSVTFTVDSLAAAATKTLSFTVALDAAMTQGDRVGAIATVTAAHGSEQVSVNVRCSNVKGYAFGEGQIAAIGAYDASKLVKVGSIRDLYGAIAPNAGATWTDYIGGTSYFWVKGDNNYPFVVTDDGYARNEATTQTHKPKVLVAYGGRGFVDVGDSYYVADGWGITADMLEIGDYFIINNDGGTQYMTLLKQDGDSLIFGMGGNRMNMSEIQLQTLLLKQNLFFLVRVAHLVEVNKAPATEEPTPPPAAGSITAGYESSLDYETDTVAKGDRLTVTVTITNNSANATAANLPVTQNVIGGTITAATDSGVIAADGTSVTWTIAETIPAGQSVTRSFTVKVTGGVGEQVVATMEESSAQWYIGSQLSSAQTDVLANLNDTGALAGVASGTSATNWLRAMFTEVMQTTKDGVTGYGSFDSNYFSGSSGSMVVKDNLSADTIWNMIMYYRGSLFAASEHEKYLDLSKAFDLDVLEPGDYVTGKGGGNNRAAVYLGKDGDNHRFAYYDQGNSTASVITCTNETFATALMANWEEEVYILRPARVYDLYNNMGRYTPAYTVSNGLSQYNSVVTGSTVTYTVSVTNESDAEITKDVVALGTVTNDNGGNVEVLNKSESVTVAAGATEIVTFTVDLTGITPWAAGNWANTLSVTVSIDEESQVLTNAIGYGIDPANAAKLLENATAITGIADVRTIYKETLGMGDSANSDNIKSISTYFGPADASSAYVFKLAGDVYVRNAVKTTGRMWASTVVMWGGSKTKAEADDAQHIAAAELNFDHLEAGDFFAINVSDGTLYKMYLGKTEEGGNVTYWFAEKGTGKEKVAYTAANAATYLANANYFAVIRLSNYYNLG